MINRKTILIIILLISMALLARWLPGTRTIDDSYITFRYARNLLAGEGFVYNSGQHVLGTTTPLFTLSMVTLGSLTGGTQAPFPWLALAVNSIADTLTCLLLWQLGKRFKTEWAGIAAGLMWAWAPFSVTFAIGGLETSVYIFFLTAAVWALLEKKNVLLCLFAALSLLTRPDALILLGPLGLARLWMAYGDKQNKNPIKLPEILTLAIPLLIWGIFATLTFGSPIPHSVQAKVDAYSLEAWEGPVRLIQHFANAFHQYSYLGKYGTLLGLILLPALFYIGARRMWKNDKYSLPFLLYPLLYFLTFAISNPLIFRWYLTPPLPAYYLSIMIGLEITLKRVFALRQAQGPPFDMAQGPHSNENNPQTWRKWAIAGIMLLPLLSLLSAWDWKPDHGPQRPAPNMAWFKLELLYQEASEYLIPLLEPDQVLAAGDVGVLGFFTNARILDTVGLNSPESLPYYPVKDPAAFVTNYAIPAELILDQQPDWIVIQEVYGRNTLLKNEDFLNQYKLQKTLPNDIYGSEGMLIFSRVNE